MNRILLALSILGAGAAGLSTIRQSTIVLQRQTDVSREAWIVQTQLVAIIQNDQSQIIAKVSELKQALAQAQPVVESPLWSALQTNRPGHLPPEVREHLLEELGFKWASPEDFIVVSKDTLRDIGLTPLYQGRKGKLADIAATLLVLTPEQRGQIEASFQRVHADFTNWALSHTVRTEPKGDVVAQYTLEGDPAMSVSNNFFSGVLEAVGRDRAELVMASSWDLFYQPAIRAEQESMIVRRYEAGTENRLRVELHRGQGSDTQYDLWQSDSGPSHFPKDFLPFFPNGWADVARREGFEIPTKPPRDKP